MLSRRFHLRGLFAVLLALMTQLAVGASVPRLDPVTATATLCHSTDDAGGAPSNAPSQHPADCLVCPLCAALNNAPATLVATIDMPGPRAIEVVLKTELPPPSTAPPGSHRPPNQPRAPPIFS